MLLEKKYGGPLITNDGVTIAKEIELPDADENMGAQLIKDVASKTNDVAGDGTTTATVLAAELLQEGIRNVVAGANPVLLKRGMSKALDLVVDKLDEMAKPVQTEAEIAQVASISAQDPEVGEVISKLMTAVGHEGVITVEESQTFGISSEVVEGMQFDNGYISPYMITDPNRMEAVYDNALLLVTDEKISSFKNLLPLLEAVAQSGAKELVILAEDIDGDALTNIVLNKLRGAFSILGIKAPGFGDRRKEMLKDICALTGASFVSKDLGMKLEDVQLHDLGHARKVIAKADKSLIVDGAGQKQAIDQRIAEIKVMIENAKHDFDKEKLAERLAKLTGGIAVIKVGAATEVEMKERKMRIEDALNATKAAVLEGMVAGGGSALLHASKVLENFEGANQDETIGGRLVARILPIAMKQIAENAGVSGDVVVHRVLESQDSHYGYNALTDTYGDMFQFGVVDPKMVTRTALENAISVVGTLLTTGAVITDIPEPEKADPSAGMGGMGMM